MRRFTWIVVVLVAIALIPVAIGLSHRGRANLPRPANRVAFQVTDSGLVPAEVKVPEGKPITVVVTRQTKDPATRELILPDSGIHKDLPYQKPVEITFTPDAPGMVRLACGLEEARIVVEQ
jgi:plastocyanin domain-containing protein